MPDKQENKPESPKNLDSSHSRSRHNQQNNPQPKPAGYTQRTAQSKALRIYLKLTLTILALEIGIIALLQVFDLHGRWSHFWDSILLLIVTTALIYMFVVKPIQSALQQSEMSRDALRRSEEKYRILVESAGQAIFTLNHAGNFTFMNTSAATQLGGKPDDFVGKTMWDLFPKPIADRQIANVRNVIRSGKPAIHEEQTVVTGKPRWYETRIQPLNNAEGEPDSAICIANDITARKKAEQAMRESEERFRTLVSNIPGAVYRSVYDGQWTVQFLSPAAKDITGYDAWEFINNNVRSPVDIMHPEDRKNVVESATRCIERRESYALEYRIIHADGEIRWVCDRGRGIFADNGDLLYIDGVIADITERRSREQTVRLQSKIVENMSEGVSMVGADNAKIIYGNRRFEQIFGYDAGELIGQNVEILNAPSDHKTPAAVRDEILAVLDENGAWSGKIRNVRKDGTLFWTRASVTAFTTDDYGRVWVCILEDITERLQTELLLKESEQRYRAIFQNAANGILVADIETKKFKFANPAICQMLGYSEEELTELGVADIHPEEDLELAHSEFDAVGRAEEFHVPELRCRRKDGMLLYVNISAARVSIGGQDYVVGFFTDITARKRAQQALRASEVKYRSLIENIPDVTWTTSRQGRTIFISPNVERVYGYSPQEIYEHQDIWLGRIHPDDIEKVKQGYELFFDKGIPYDAEYRIKRKDGRWIWLHDRAIKSYELGGEHYADGVLDDVTARKHVEAELKRAENELQEFREKMVRAERLASLGTLSAMLAHELTQPLTVASLTIENSLDEFKKSSSSDITATGLRETLKQISNAAQIVDRFRSFARRSSPRSEHKLEPAKIAKKIVDLLAKSAARVKMTIKLDGMEELPPILCNQSDFEQLFFVLIQNAIQAAKGSTATILTISGSVRDSDMFLEFADNCGGIAPEHLDKVFEPFFTTKPPGQGTGLGLCIAEQIVSRYRGKIRVDSRFGSGATFCVILPVQSNSYS